MEFNRSKDDLHEQLFFKYVCVEENIEIGVHPVLFGFRVRVSFMNDIVYQFDYCAGSEQEHVNEIYNLVLNILRKQDKFDLSVFPSWKRRPIHNDPECINKLRELSGELIESVVVPDVYIYRTISFEHITKSAKDEKL